MGYGSYLGHMEKEGWNYSMLLTTTDHCWILIKEVNQSLVKLLLKFSSGLAKLQLTWRVK